MVEHRWAIPDSWKWVSIAQIATVVGGGTPSSKDSENFADHGVPWITPSDLTGYTDAYITRGKRDLSQIGYSSSNATLVPKGSVLFSSRAPIGYCVIASNEISTSQGFKNLVLYGGVSARFLRHYLLSSKKYAESKASGTTFLELSAKKMGELSVPLAPFAEQERIADELDRLLRKISDARIALEQVNSLIRLYKQSVVDMAFSTLKMVVPLINLVDGRGIPYGIVQTGSGVAAGVPTVRAGDIKDFTLLEAGLKRVSRNISDSYSRTLLKGGEVLLAIRGSVGETCVVPPSMVGGNISREVALIPVLETISPKFIMYFLKSKSASNYIQANVKGIAQTGINLRDLRHLPAPDIKLGEQIEIVEEIESSFQTIQKVFHQVESSLSLLDKLGQSVSERAFRGDLLPQNPLDVSADELILEIGKARMDARAALKTILAPPVLAQRKRNLAVSVVEALKSNTGWVSASQLALTLGLGDGSNTEAIEKFYGELRQEVLAGHVLVERRGTEDWLKLQICEAA
ncbi:restriction endonuclease subunit S [Agrobacterium tumefaciens]|uniref:restriction endonuclease subunit S n=1 Tax=Agrobacterium tumefaciens TaxID=358 RepID=UPI003B9FD8AA